MLVWMSTSTLLKETYRDQLGYQAISTVCCHAAVLFAVHACQACIRHGPHLGSAAWRLCNPKQQRHESQADQSLLHSVHMHRPLPLDEEQLDHSQGSVASFKAALLAHTYDAHACTVMQNESFQKGVVVRRIQPIRLIHLPFQQLVHKVECQL